MSYPYVVSFGATVGTALKEDFVTLMYCIRLMTPFTYHRSAGYRGSQIKYKEIQPKLKISFKKMFI